jgi:prevent-host-death family protein
MGKPEALTQTMTVSDVREDLDAIVERVSRTGARVLVEQAGAPLAAIVSTEDFNRLARLDADRARHRQLLARLREPFTGVPPEQIERDVVELVREVRADLASEQPPAAVER